MLNAEDRRNSENRKNRENGNQPDSKATAALPEKGGQDLHQQPEEPLIELRHISKSFRAGTEEPHHALKNINLSIYAGDFITIVGGNGAGKSTLLSIIAGSLAADSGEVRIQGKNVTDTHEHERAQYISRVFQNPLDGTAPRMTIAENMALALRRGKRRGLAMGSKRTEQGVFRESLAALKLGLEDRLNTEIGLLSGGQRQAVSLLMATMKEPLLLLLDEHTAALDPNTQKKIMNLTEEKIKEKSLTAFMITHNLKDAIQYGNRLLLMHQGEIHSEFALAEKEKLTANQLYQMMNELSAN